MITLVLRTLIHDARRTALTVVAIAAVIAVIVILEGLNAGLLAQLRSVATARGADLILTQSGISHMTAARSVLPQYTRAHVEAVEGVAAAHPLTGIPVIYAQAQRRTPVFVLVYDTLGGPAHISDGSAPVRSHEIVIDRSLAYTYGLRPGDPFVIADFPFVVSGIADDAAAFFTPFAFLRFDDLIDFYFASDLATDISTFPLLSFLLVDIHDEYRAETVRQTLEQSVPEIDAFVPGKLAENDAHLGNVLFGPVFGLLIGVSYLIGLVVTAIIAFAAVNTRRRELAVLKALGFRDRALAGGVVLHSLVMTILAIPLGLAVALLIAWAIERLMPLYLVQPADGIIVLRTTLACLTLSATGALASIARLRKVDPVMAFGGV